MTYLALNEQQSQMAGQKNKHSSKQKNKQANIYFIYHIVLLRYQSVLYDIVKLNCKSHKQGLCITLSYHGKLSISINGLNLTSCPAIKILVLHYLIAGNYITLN